MNNRLTQKLGIELPIIQGPMGGFATQRLAATVSNGGGLGSFGAHSLPPSAICEVIDEIRSLTDKPFAMNLWVSIADEGALSLDKAGFQRDAAPVVIRYLRELGAPMPVYKPFQPTRFEDQARVLIDAKVPVFSFIFGIPPKEILDECRRKGIVLAGGATSVAEARALQDAGVDAIVASGFEAGGHRGSFLRPSEESLMGTFSLVPQIADAVDVPVIAAGGIADARGVAAAFALGAVGAQVGTAFLACLDSGATEAHRRAILEGRASDTDLTDGFTGRLARGIRNRLMEDLDAPGVEILPYPLQRQLIKSLTAAAESAGREDLLVHWAGQSASLARYEDAAELLRSLATGLPSR